MRTIDIAGTASASFEAVPEVAARLLALEGSRGAALTVRYGGHSVVDITLGEYAVDGLQLVFSVSKAISAIAIAHAGAHGLVDVDAPLVEQWPELMQPDVQSITPRDVLAHRSGLASLDVELSLDQLIALDDERAIALQSPYWKPRSAHGYHAFTFGTLLGGWFRRATGQSLGEYVQSAIAEPYGIEVWLGAPESVHPRVQSIDYPQQAATTRHRTDWAAHSEIPVGSTARIAHHYDLFNDPRLWSACLPSTSGIASSRGLARLVEATMDGSLLSDAALADLTATQARGPDRVLGIPMHYGSGVQLPFPQLPMLGPGSFGHEAAGGSAVVGDPATGLVVAWTTTSFPAMAGASAAFLALLPTVRHCAGFP